MNLLLFTGCTSMGMYVTMLYMYDHTYERHVYLFLFIHDKCSCAISIHESFLQNECVLSPAIVITALTAGITSSPGPWRGMFHWVNGRRHFEPRLAIS